METITASEARANFAEILGRVSFGKERITIERSGKPVALLVPVPDAGSTAIDNDITERQRAEERFRRYFDLPLVGSAIYAPDKKWIAVNDTLCDLLGYIMETDYGLEMPRRLQIEFSGIVQTAADGRGRFQDGRQRIEESVDQRRGERLTFCPNHLPSRSAITITELDRLDELGPPPRHEILVVRDLEVIAEPVVDGLPQNAVGVGFRLYARAYGLGVP